MHYNEQYAAFGIVSGIASFWYALTLLVIYNEQFGGWFFVLVSAGIVWGMKHYTVWLFKPFNRHQLLIILSVSQIVPTILIFLILFLKQWPSIH